MPKFLSVIWLILSKALPFTLEIKIKSCIVQLRALTVRHRLIAGWLVLSVIHLEARKAKPL